MEKSKRDAASDDEDDGDDRRRQRRQNKYPPQQGRFMVLSQPSRCKFTLKLPLKVQCSPFVMLCLGYMGLDHVISEFCFKGAILHRNYRKMAI